MNHTEPIFNPSLWTPQPASGYVGQRRQERIQEMDQCYGAGHWEVGYQWGNLYIRRELALQFYEDAYFEFFQANPDVLGWLVTTARDIYDTAESNTQSGLDYTRQETPATHLQDIAIRRAVLRLGRTFQGEQLIQIRGQQTPGYRLNPGKVSFHRPELITLNELCPTWADPNSIEAFWQCNKRLMVLQA